MNLRPLLAAGAVTVSALAVSTPAQAGPLRLSETVSSLGTALLPKQDPTCVAAETSKPFATFGDRADYVPVPGGSFEDGLGAWDVRGPVSLVDDNEPWKVGGAGHATAAALTDGASLTSGTFCGGLEYPTIRMFTRTDDRHGLLQVNVLYTVRDNLLHALPLGVVTAGNAWRPSEITLTASGLPLLTGVKLGVTVTSLAGDVTVDDLYVDPYRRS